MIRKMEEALKQIGMESKYGNEWTHKNYLTLLTDTMVLFFTKVEVAPSVIRFYDDDKDGEHTYAFYVMTDRIESVEVRGGDIFLKTKGSPVNVDLSIIRYLEDRKWKQKILKNF